MNKEIIKHSGSIFPVTVKNNYKWQYVTIKPKQR